MTLLRAVVLGIVQGATEFVPVSSSGHLILTRWALGWRLGPPGVEKAFDVAVHAGTLTGAVMYLRADLAAVVAGSARAIRARAWSPDARLATLLAFATVPAALTGAVFEDVVTERLGAPWLVASALVVFGAVLALADRGPETLPMTSLGWRDAALVGAAQAAALQPGVSRSGATMAAARALGYGRDAAARLSFLMSIPLIAGAAGFEAATLGGTGLDAGDVVAMAVGAFAAGVTAMGAISLVLGVVRTRSVRPFVIYRVVAGVTVLAALAVP
jgi:undecaprenyl-diphosphatase